MRLRLMLQLRNLLYVTVSMPESIITGIEEITVLEATQLRADMTKKDASVLRLRMKVLRLRQNAI